MGVDGSWVGGFNVYQWYGVYGSCDVGGGWFGVLGLLTLAYCSEYLIILSLIFCLK